MSKSVIKQIANLSNLDHDALKNLYVTLHGSEPRPTTGILCMSA